MTTTTEIDTVSAKNLRVGDRVLAIFDPEAKRRQPAGWRQGDPVVKGAFRKVTEHTVKDVTRDDKTTEVLAQAIGASAGTWQAPVANDTRFEILRVVTF